jgi:CspA family cold shock protein
MAIGTVKTWHDDRGFGFIKDDDGSGADLFAHAKSVIGASVLVPGQRVEFDRDRGKYRATDVRVI